MAPTGLRQSPPGSLPFFGISTAAALLLARVPRGHVLSQHHRCRPTVALMQLPMANALLSEFAKTVALALNASSALKAERGFSDTGRWHYNCTSNSTRLRRKMKILAFSLSLSSARRTLYAFRSGEYYVVMGDRHTATHARKTSFMDGASHVPYSHGSFDVVST